MSGFKLQETLYNELISNIDEIVVEPNIEIVRKGQYINVVPIVIEGLVKVYTSYNEKELLLYYIKPNESCTMSFAAAINQQPSSVFAVTENEVKLILVPIAKLQDLAKKHASLNMLFFNLFHDRYQELVNTINHLLFDKLDQRVYDFLKERIELMKNKAIKISHTQIATELGTSREVVSRILKKLESEQKLEQTNLGIKIN